MGRHRREDVTFRLLFVCTGNICRSPFAEILTRHLLVGRLGGRAAAAFEVASAGVQAVVGAPVHPDTRAELFRWGPDARAADRFVARQLRPEMIEQADLVLGAGPRHRSASVERVPGALATAFALREFTRLAAAVDPVLLPDAPVARAHALVEQARMQRGRVPPRDPAEDGVPDPMGRSPEAHRAAARLIGEAVGTIVDLVAPPQRRPVHPRHAPPGARRA